MNKKLIALALAALPAAAMADVTIYGQIRGGYEYNKTYNSTLSKDANGKPQGSSEVNDWTSRLGFKGNEDLGNGLKAIWQVESAISVDGTNSTGFGTRDTFIGLAGDGWGQIRLGRLSNYPNMDMEQVDPGYYSTQSVGGLGMFTRLDTRVNNAIRYDSPNWYGFSYMVLWGADEARAQAADGSRTNNQLINIGLSYENSGYFGKYSFVNLGDSNKVGSGLKDWHRLEAGYNANNIYAAFGYQQVRGYLGQATTTTGGVTTVTGFADKGGVAYNVNALNAAFAGQAAGFNVAQVVKTKELALTGGYTFGSFTPYLSYVKGYDVSIGGSTLSNSGYDQFVLSLDYALSKRTDVYTSYGHVNWKANNLTSESSFGLGLIHRF
ncbi:porin [Pseudogulbenkiania ferrooxidans]|uniref:Porin n=1 Tax=Pseudogulbenkiania ferrooxidans EGD-HP2 TaxID=1388764 RepID=A0ABN0N166_9NEIS|nr:porin [Pseudogulbenkiania ferrooxidans]ERD99183.1 porin [Pseudogulbenkiania ferrooxidans EGD-HP2]